MNNLVEFDNIMVNVNPSHWRMTININNFLRKVSEGNLIYVKKYFIKIDEESKKASGYSILNFGYSTILKWATQNIEMLDYIISKYDTIEILDILLVVVKNSNITILKHVIKHYNVKKKDLLKKGKVINHDVSVLLYTLQFRKVNMFKYLRDEFNYTLKEIENINDKDVYRLMKKYYINI